MTRNLTIAVVALAFLAAVPAAQAGVLDGVDILNINGIFESSMAASNMTTARAVLTGEGATVTDVSIGSFGASDLVGIDILYIGLVNNGFTAAQETLVANYVASGGGLVAVGTERNGYSGAAFEEIANSLGVYGLGGDRGVKATAADPTSPIVNGPFGVASTYSPAATGAFNPTLPAGTNIVWEGVDNNPVIITLDVTGRAFLFADTNFMENGYIGNGDNRTIWGNAFAFTGKVSVVPLPAAAWAGLGLLGMLGAFRRIRRRRS